MHVAMGTQAPPFLPLLEAILKGTMGGWIVLRCKKKKILGNSFLKNEMLL